MIYNKLTSQKHYVVINSRVSKIKPDRMDSTRTSSFIKKEDKTCSSTGWIWLQTFLSTSIILNITVEQSQTGSWNQVGSNHPLQWFILRAVFDTFQDTTMQDPKWCCCHAMGIWMGCIRSHKGRPPVELCIFLC